jgi:hypothetical protein
MILARTRFRLALAMIAGLLATACGKPAPEVDPWDRISTGGIRYEIAARAPGGGPTPSGSDLSVASDLLKGVTGNGFKWSAGSLSLEVADGEITFNGKKCGPVKEGDTVRVTRDGTLFVNGDERKPTGG